MAVLRKIEGRDLLQKITPIVGLAVDRWLLDKRWTSFELSEKTGIPASRFTEYRNCFRYKRAVSAQHVITMRKFGVLTDAQFSPLLNREELEWLGFDVVQAVES